jgi:hypothetical protein
MRQFSFLLILCFCVVFMFSCQHSIAPKTEGGIEGQIYEIGHAGGVPSGWTPPPLREVRTIVVSDNNKVGIHMLSSDSMGAFKISLQPGTYYLLVKDTTWLQEQNGPIVVEVNQIVSVKAYHDNRMR